MSEFMGLIYGKYEAKVSTNRTTLKVHHAFCSFLTARLKRETFQWDIL